MSAVRPGPATAGGGLQPHRRRRALGVLAVVAAILLAGAGVDALAPPAPPADAGPAPRQPATAGTWYCPSVGTEGERAVVTVAAVGADAASVAVDRYGPDGVVRGTPADIEPGSDLTVALEEDDARRPVTVRWAGGPAVASWRVDGERTAAAPCEPAPAATWHIAGFDTTLGSQSRLHLFNPFDGDAVVRLIFATPEGPVRLVLTDNLVAQAGDTTTVNLARFQPEIADLGVTVEVLAGRVVAQGELRSDPPGDTAGTSGRTLLPAAAEPALTAHVPEAQQGEGSESWLAVLNPGDRDAAVEVTVTDPVGGAGSAGEASVPAGGIIRLELDSTSQEPVLAATVTGVNDVPVVVMRMSALPASGNRTGVTAALATPQPASRWALVGAGTRRREGVVSVYNPGAEAATVDLLADGAPRAWRDVVVEPNSRADFPLSAAQDDRVTVPVLVTADVPVVAGLRSVSEGPSLRPWAALGVPARTWVGPPQQAPVRLDPTLATRPLAPPPTGGDLTDPAAPLPGDQSAQPSSP